MSQCPFHKDSHGTEQDGEINRITCVVCGEYQISGVALNQMKAQNDVPSGWTEMVRKTPLISTRNTRALLAGAA